MTKPYYGVNNIIWDGTQWVASSKAVASDTTNANGVAFTSSDAANWTAVPYLSDPFCGPREDYNATSPYDGQRYDAGNPYDIADIPNGTDPAVIATHKKRYAAGIKLPYATGNWVVFGTNPTWTKGVALAYNTTTGAYTDSAGVWIKTTLPVAGRWTNMAYGNNRWVAVSGDNNGTDNKSIISTSDGKGWSAATLPSTLSWRDITYKNNMFITTTTSNTNVAAVLNDGSNTWTTSYLPSSGSWRTINSIDNYAIAFKYNTDTIARTTNGYSWTSATLPTSGGWIDSEFGFTKSTNTNVASTHSDVAVYTNVKAHEVPVRTFNNVQINTQTFYNIQPNPYELVGTYSITGTRIKPASFEVTQTDTYGPRVVLVDGSIIGYNQYGGYYWDRNGANISATVGQSFLISGTYLGGTSANNALLTVTAVDGSGYISAATVSGTNPGFISARIKIQISTSGSSNFGFTYSIVTAGTKYRAGQILNLRSSAVPYVNDGNGAWPIQVTSVNSSGAITGLTPLYTSAPYPTAPTADITVNQDGTITTTITNGRTNWSDNDNFRISFSIPGFPDAAVYKVVDTDYPSGTITQLYPTTSEQVFDPIQLSVYIQRYGTATLTPTITNQGYYPDGTKLKIYGSQIGGIDGTNDVIYTVKMDPSNTFVDDLIKYNTPTIPTGPTFDIVRDKAVVTSITLDTTAPGFKVGDQLVIQNDDLNIVLSVTGVNAQKEITTFTAISAIARYAPEVAFDVTRTGSTYTAVLRPQELYYQVAPNAIFRIHAIDVGGTSPVLTPDAYQTDTNDVIITVNTVTAKDFKGDNLISTFTVTGTGKPAIESTFNVVRNRKVYSATENFPGSGFVPGQVITIQGNLVDGYAPTHNVSITVNSIKTVLRSGVYQSGVINTFTVTGTGIDGAIVAISFLDDNKIVRSVDGINWTQHSLPTNAICNSITWGETAAGGIYLVAALDSDTYYTSSDGKSWTEYTLPYSSTWRDTIYLNGKVNIYDNSRYGISNDLTTTFEAEGWLDVEGNYESPWTETQIDEIFYSNGRYYGFGSGTIDGETYPLIWTSTTISTNKGDWSIYPGSGLTQIVSATDTGEEVLVTDGSKIYAIPSDISETNTALIYRAGPFGETIERIEANDGYVYVFTATQTLISPIGA